MFETQHLQALLQNFGVLDPCEVCVASPVSSKVEKVCEQVRIRVIHRN